MAVYAAGPDGPGDAVSGLRALTAQARAQLRDLVSPRESDGRPQPLFDQDTGAINATVAKTWERYDIAEIIRRSADRLRPLLDGKIHLTVGTQTPFALDSAARLLEQTMKEARIRATFTYLEGQGHFDLDRSGWMPVHGGLLEQIFAEMEAVARATEVIPPKRFRLPNANRRLITPEELCFVLGRLTKGRRAYQILRAALA